MTAIHLTADRFDDHLELAARELAQARLVAFHGVSGSGKSTAIAYLTHAHPAFRSHSAAVVAGPEIDWRAVQPATELVVVDECTRARDLLGIVSLLRRGHRVLAASHLPRASSLALGAVWPVVAIATDREPAKIGRYLAARGIAASAAGVAAFCRRFGASYTMADMVLDYDGGRDFDRAFDRFTRNCRVAFADHAGRPT